LIIIPQSTALLVQRQEKKQQDKATKNLPIAGAKRSLSQVMDFFRTATKKTAHLF
jgi:hypothetical protein